MSLLSICTQVCNSLGIFAPSTIVGNNDETALRLLGAAQDEGEALARKPENGWVAMIAEYDFYTSATANNIPGTIQTIGGFAQISGLTFGTTQNPVTAGNWYAYGTDCPQQAIITAVVSNDPNSSVTLNQPGTDGGVATAGTFTLGQSDYALPSDFQRVVDNTLWDRSRFWSMRGPQSPQQWQLYKSSVIGRASIQRRFRFREINGSQMFSIDPVPTDNGSALVFEYVSNAWCESSTGTKQTSWQADSDTGIISEYLMRLGIKWRMLKGLGFNYQSELNEYEVEVSKAMAKDGGMAILDMTPNDQLTLIGPWNLPETGFGSGVFGD